MFYSFSSLGYLKSDQFKNGTDLGLNRPVQILLCVAAWLYEVI